MSLKQWIVAVPLLANLSHGVPEKESVYSGFCCLLPLYGGLGEQTEPGAHFEHVRHDQESQMRYFGLFYF